MQEHYKAHRNREPTEDEHETPLALARMSSRLDTYAVRLSAGSA